LVRPRNSSQRRADRYGGDELKSSCRGRLLHVVRHGRPVIGRVPLVWRAPLAWDLEDQNQVFVDGHPLTEARWPTNSGTLSATGAITFQSGSKYQVDLSSAGTVSTILTTTGTASVTGSTLTVTSSDGTYDLGNPITILHASGGITGAFTSSQTFTSLANSAVFKSAITATNTDLYLTVNLYQITPAISAISGATVNQQHVGAGIDAALAAADKANTTNTTVPKGFEVLGNDTVSDLRTHTTQLAGEIGADTPLVAKAAFAPFLDALSARTAMQRPLGKDQTQPLETWVSAYGGTDIITGDVTGNGSHKFNAKVAGVVAGAQWTPWSNVVLGGALSAGRSDFHIAEDLGKGNATSIQAGVYGYVQASRHFYTSFAAGAGLSSTTVTIKSSCSCWSNDSSSA